MRALSPRRLPAEAEAEMLTAKVAQLPETRSEKVAAIGSAIREGNYFVSPEQTAEAMLSEMASQAAHHGQAIEGKDTVAAANSTPPKPSTPGFEPSTPHSQPTSGSKKHRRTSRPALRDDEFREDSQPARDLMDSSG